jgi:hypothetical protein
VLFAVFERPILGLEDVLEGLGPAKGPADLGRHLGRGGLAKDLGHRSNPVSPDDLRLAPGDPGTDQDPDQLIDGRLIGGANLDFVLHGQRSCADADATSRAAHTGRALTAGRFPRELRSPPPSARELEITVPLCPIDPGHGLLLEPKQAGEHWMCVHQAHDGRPKSHPDGPAPGTRFRFSAAELGLAPRAPAHRTRHTAKVIPPPDPTDHD